MAVAPRPVKPKAGVGPAGHLSNQLIQHYRSGQGRAQPRRGPQLPGIGTVERGLGAAGGALYDVFHKLAGQRGRGRKPAKKEAGRQNRQTQVSKGPVQFQQTQGALPQSVNLGTGAGVGDVFADYYKKLRSIPERG